MKTLLECEFLPDHDFSASKIKDFFVKFADLHENWSFPIDESADYEKTSGSTAFYVLNNQSTNLPLAAVAIGKKEDKKENLKVWNIVPRTKSQLTQEEYNSILKRLLSDLIYFKRRNRSHFKIKKGKEEIGIEDILRSKGTLWHWNRFLKGYPLSFHPNDIEHLDCFIVAWKSNSRKNEPNLDLFRRYLIEELNWKKEHAEWCVNRIDIGFHVLQAKRNMS